MAISPSLISCCDPLRPLENPLIALIHHSGMRENPLTASPLHAFAGRTVPQDADVDFARRPYDESETWPSTYGFGGRVGWKTFEAKEDGDITVSYPEIR